MQRLIAQKFVNQQNINDKLPTMNYYIVMEKQNKTKNSTFLLASAFPMGGLDDVNQCCVITS